MPAASRLSAPVPDSDARGPMMDEKGPALLIRVEEAASILGIGRTQTFELITQGSFTSVKIGRRSLVVRQDLESFVRRLSTSQNTVGANA